MAITRTLAAVLVAILLAAGCGRNQAETPSAPPSTTTAPTTTAPDPLAECETMADHVLAAAQDEAEAMPAAAEALSAAVAEVRGEIAEARETNRVNRSRRDEIRAAWYDERGVIAADEDRFGYRDTPEYEALIEENAELSTALQELNALADYLSAERLWYGDSRSDRALVIAPERWGQLQIGLRDALWCFAGELPNHCGGQTALDARSARVMAELPEHIDVWPLIEDASGYLQCYIDAANRR